MHPSPPPFLLCWWRLLYCFFASFSFCIKQNKKRKKVFPVHQCKLAKATKPGGLYQFPRSLNLVGPPCEGGHLLIMSPRLSSGENGGAAAAAKSLPVRGSLASGRGGRSNGTGDSVTAMATAHVLRLAVSVKAGPPVKVLIRSPKLGAEEFSSEIRATLLAGLKVNREGGRKEGRGAGGGLLVVMIVLFFLASLVSSLFMCSFLFKQTNRTSTPTGREKPWIVFCFHYHLFSSKQKMPAPSTIILYTPSKR